MPVIVLFLFFFFDFSAAGFVQDRTRIAVVEKTLKISLNVIIVESRRKSTSQGNFITFNFRRYSRKSRTIAYVFIL